MIRDNKIGLNDRFYATDSMGRTITYTYLQRNIEVPMREFILLNEIDGSITEVEKAWFSRRHIVDGTGKILEM